MLIQAVNNGLLLKVMKQMGHLYPKYFGPLLVVHLMDNTERPQ